LGIDACGLRADGAFRAVLVLFSQRETKMKIDRGQIVKLRVAETNFSASWRK
jgi:hypothetical protein